LYEPQPNDAEALLLEIEATRERIARTASALAYRADMPMRVRDTVREKLALASASAKPYAARIRSIAIDAAAISRYALARAAKLALARAGSLAQARDGSLARARDGSLALARAGNVALVRAGNVALTRAGTLAQAGASKDGLRDAVRLSLPKSAPAIFEGGPDGQLRFALGALGAGFVIGLLLPGKARSR
jgi:hypothetical protein